MADTHWIDVATDLAYDTHRDPAAFIATYGSRWAGIPYSPAVYRDIRAVARSGEAWTGGPTTVTVQPPARVVFNKDEPAHPQDKSFDCSQESLEWALWALGRRPTDGWLEERMIAERVMSPEQGLLDATGAGLAAFVIRHYSEFGYDANFEASVTFDAVALEIGPYPLLIGGRHFGPGGHWVGVRGYDGERGLLLANPADGYQGVGQTLNRQQWAAYGPWSMVRVLHFDLLAKEPPPQLPPPPDPRQRQRELLGEIRVRVEELSALIG